MKRRQKMKTEIYSENAPEAIGPYSQAVKIGNIVFTSGQIAIAPQTGKLTGNEIREQTHIVCRNLSEVLKAAGTTLENVVKTTCYLSDMSDFDEFNKVYAEYFKSRPARSCVSVKALPKGALVEIEVTAETERV